MSGWFNERHTRQAIVVPLEDPAGQNGSGAGMVVVLLVLALMAVLAAPRLIDALDPDKRERERQEQRTKAQDEHNKVVAEIERENRKVAAEIERGNERHAAWLRFLDGLRDAAGLAAYGAVAFPVVWGALRLAQLAASEARQARQDRLTREALRQGLPATPDLMEAKRREREQRHALYRIQYQVQQAQQDNDRLIRELARERARQALELLPETTPN